MRYSFYSMNLFPFIPGYTSAIYDTGREPAFVMLLAFFISYLLARGYTRIARKTGWGSPSFGGTHTHHMVFGLVISFVAGALMFSFLPQQGPLLLLLAAAFGGGAALVLDEFALIFHLEDVYWEEEGRKSIDAVVLGVAFGGLFLLRASPFDTSINLTGWAYTVTIVINITFSVIAGLKGKIFFALFGIFIPLIASIGAIRLAEPESIWATRMYKKPSKKMTKSIKRYKNYHKKWGSRKEKMWDIIGGKTGRPPLKT